MSFELRLFGSTEVRINGEAIARPATRKSLWILCMLALRSGTAVDREWLAGILWPDSDDSQALRSLRQCLHHLRQSLGSESWRVKSESPRALRFESSDSFVDALEF